ncbi:hypothetical protein BDQ17DRAFT_986476 [Cyathus striatus]|nr:hypothetical protein BDQ17DRAFT_986476 [Cyathus striatus]
MMSIFGSYNQGRRGKWFRINTAMNTRVITTSTKCNIVLCSHCKTSFCYLCGLNMIRHVSCHGTPEPNVATRVRNAQNEAIAEVRKYNPHMEIKELRVLKR